MANPSPKKSPFKTFQTANAGYVPRVSISQLDIDRPYKMYAIYDVTTKIGHAKLVYMVKNDNKRVKAYLPPAAIAKLGDTMPEFEQVIKDKKMPYIIYRGTHEKDSSFLIDFVDPEDEQLLQSLNMKEAFQKWLAVDRLPAGSPNTSIEIDEKEMNELDSSDIKEGPAKETPKDDPKSAKKQKLQ